MCLSSNSLIAKKAVLSLCPVQEDSSLCCLTQARQHVTKAQPGQRYFQGSERQTSHLFSTLIHSVLDSWSHSIVQKLKKMENIFAQRKKHTWVIKPCPHSSLIVHERYGLGTRLINMADFAAEYQKDGGFSFENCKRNALLGQKGFTAPKYTKTGTTIVGIKFKDGIILGADTRATEDTIVAELNCEKIHYIADNIYCCGAGTAADTEMTTKMISSKLELHRLNTGRTPRVVTAERMLAQKLFRYQGYIGAALILGGVDPAGIHLYQIYPHGSTDELPFVTMGSGSLAAMSVFESGWKVDLDRQTGMQLVQDAIRAGIFNDLGSGSNVDLCILTKDGTEYLRNYELANKKGVRQGSYRYKQGTTAVLSTQVKKIDFDVTSTRIQPVEPMET